MLKLAKLTLDCTAHKCYIAVPRLWAALTLARIVRIRKSEETGIVPYGIGSQTNHLPDVERMCDSGLAAFSFSSSQDHPLRWSFFGRSS